MGRNKYPEETIERILNVSLNLFLEKGYDQTTLQDIADGMGDLSKGAIYHHFKGKEEIIDALTTKIYQKTNPFELVLKMKNLNGLEKIMKVFEQSMTSSINKQLFSMASSIMRNPKFLAKQFEECMNVLAPNMEKMIVEGIEDGSIKVKNPKLTSQAILLFTNIWLTPGIFNVTSSEYIEKIEYIKYVTDALGLPIITDHSMELLLLSVDKII